MLTAALIHLGLYILLVWAIIAERSKLAIVLAAIGFVASLVQAGALYISLGN